MRFGSGIAPPPSPSPNSSFQCAVRQYVAVQSCAEAAEDQYVWMVLLLVVPAFVNCCSLALILATVVHLRQLKSVTEAVTSRWDCTAHFASFQQRQTFPWPNFVA